jgi:hypothetical protein
MNGIRNGTGRRVPTSIGMLAALVLALGTAEAAQAETAQLSLDMSAQRFAVEGDKVVARGPVEATVVQADGTTHTVRKQVSYRVTPTRNCKILKLHLAPLYLNLLGLEVRTSDINVDITGDRKGLLGGLLCGLSRSLRLDQQALTERTVRSLNRRLGKRELSVLEFATSLQSQQQPAPVGGPRARAIPPVPPGSCEVLNLMLGPLHLDVLGLIIDVYGANRNQPVQVLITANPAGGLLGQLLCGVAGDPTAGRTARQAGS